MYIDGVQLSTCPSPTLQPFFFCGSWACYHCECCLLTLLKPILKSKHQVVKLQTNVFFWSYWKILQLRMPQNIISICKKIINNTNKNAKGLYSPVYCEGGKLWNTDNAKVSQTVSLWNGQVVIVLCTHAHTLYVAAEFILKMQRSA